MERKTYKVITGLEKNLWWIEIPDIDMGFSQARQLRNVEAMAREVISLLLGVPEDSFDVSVQVRGEEADMIHDLQMLETAAQLAQDAVVAKKKAVVHKLRKKGVPVRDVAELLRVSTGQINELSKA